MAAIWAASSMGHWNASAHGDRVVSTDGDAITVVDADTVNIGADRYRLVGFDSPEIYHVGCRRERDIGLIAASRLIEIMRSGNVVVQRLPGRDKWRRGLARITVDGRDIGDTLIAEGHARPYNRRGKRSGWCGPATRGGS